MFVTKILLFSLIVEYGSFVMASSLKTDDKSYLEPFFNKKYELASSDDKFEDIMKALGVGFLTRKLGNMAKPVMWLTEKNGVFTISSESTFKNVYVDFKLGEEFDEETPDGRMVKSVITQDKNKLIHVQKGGGKTTTTIREFTPEAVKTTVKVDDIVSERIYKPL